MSHMVFDESIERDRAEDQRIEQGILAAAEFLRCIPAQMLRIPKMVPGDSRFSSHRTERVLSECRDLIRLPD